MSLTHLADKRCGKRRYPDELSARAMALNSIEVTDIKKLWVYKCKDCSGWHLTKNNQGYKKLVREGEPFF